MRWAVIGDNGTGARPELDMAMQIPAHFFSKAPSKNDPACVYLFNAEL